MTDFQNLVDGIEAASSVMSVEVQEDGSFGTLRIVVGNKAYIDSIERPAGDYQMFHNKFIPNSIYTDYVPRDLNFEDFCYRSAVQKKCMHSYVKPPHMPVWFNMTFLPVGPSEGNIHYCLYTMEVNFKANTERMSKVSADLASAVLETCIKLRGTSNFGATMRDIIADIRKLCRAQYCTILLMDTYEKKCTVLCEDFSESAEPLPSDRELGDDFFRIAESWENLIGSSNCIIAKNEQDMEFVKEKDRLWYDSLTETGVRNIVLFPLNFNDQLLGYIWACNFDGEQAPKIKETLEITTFILGSEIANHLLVDRLKELSAKDMLTGVLNRNEMNNLVEKLSTEIEVDGKDKSVGIVFADLNGLKTINDEYGHGEGDSLLKDAAKALAEVFPTGSIFRAGGDEFTVIQLGIDEEELKKKVFELKETCRKYKRVIFAVGEAVEKDSRNVRNALRTADQRMYIDKRKYYDEHPEIKKRLQ